MVLIPTSTKLKVEQMIEGATVEPDIRGYLGISSLASECERKLWYGFRICATEILTPRMKRLFSRGHREEPIIVKDLQSIGIIHHSDQKEVIFANGHGKGHCDGILENVPDAPKTPHLSEFKTANDKNFKKIKKEGIHSVYPVYTGQADCYSHLLDLKRTLFVVVNKNDDERYYERYHNDPKRAVELIDRGVDIISSELPPEKRWNSKWYKCKWCKYYEVCHMGMPVKKTCRSCQACDIHDHGKWRCSRYDIELTLMQQLLGCNKYILLTGL
ncbi:MAG: hypothetical protein GY861_24310 [bacterium]|nr:hypothetical protein [bacterium]